MRHTEQHQARRSPHLPHLRRARRSTSNRSASPRYQYPDEHAYSRLLFTIHRCRPCPRHPTPPSRPSPTCAPGHGTDSLSPHADDSAAQMWNAVRSRSTEWADRSPTSRYGTDARTPRTASASRRASACPTCRCMSWSGTESGWDRHAGRAVREMASARVDRRTEI